MIHRQEYLEMIDKALSHYSVAMLIGPRQAGKGTLAGQPVEGRTATIFDLEHPTSRELLEQPLDGPGAVAWVCGH